MYQAVISVVFTHKSQLGFGALRISAVALLLTKVGLKPCNK